MEIFFNLLSLIKYMKISGSDEKNKWACPFIREIKVGEKFNRWFRKSLCIETSMYARS